MKGHIVSKKNSKQVFVRNGRVIVLPSKAYRIWEDDALWQIKAQRVQPVDGPVSLKMALWAKDLRSSDLENKVSSVQDMLVKAGVLPDDDWKSVPKIEAEYMGVDREMPRCEVQLEVIPS